MGSASRPRYYLIRFRPHIFLVIHLDTADRRGIAHVDQPDLWDVLLFIRQWLAHVWTLFLKRPRICYLPLSQSRIGFLRDSLFMIPCSLAGSAVVAHLHGANFDQVYENGRRIFQWYVDAVLKHVAAFVVLGEMLKPIFYRWARAENIAVVPNGVPEFIAGPADRKETVESGPLRVVFLSTLSRQKGLFVLLEAIPLVAQEYPNVELTGKDKMQFLNTGDIFVFPGIQQEGQPLTVLEAMCAGLPIVATDRGCLRETIVEGVTGFIVPPQSPQALAERVVQLIREPHTRNAFGKNARLRYEQEYTMPTFAARMAELFAQVIQSDYHKNPKTIDSSHGPEGDEYASRH